MTSLQLVFLAFSFWKSDKIRNSFWTSEKEGKGGREGKKRKKERNSYIHSFIHPWAIGPLSRCTQHTAAIQDHTLWISEWYTHTHTHPPTHKTMCTANRSGSFLNLLQSKCITTISTFFPSSVPLPNEATALPFNLHTIPVLSVAPHQISQTIPGFQLHSKKSLLDISTTCLETKILFWGEHIILEQ